VAKRADVLQLFHPAVAEWFRASFEAPTPPQTLGWPAIARGESTLILAPTGSGKTLTAFLWCINRVMFDPVPPKGRRCRVLYISPLKALAVDIERNLRAPLAGIANWAVDICSPGLLAMMKERMSRIAIESGAPFLFAPPEGPEFFTPYGWTAVSVRSLLKTAGKLERLPFALRMFSLLPESPGRQGSRPWAAVCLLARSSAD